MSFGEWVEQDVKAIIDDGKLVAIEFAWLSNKKGKRRLRNDWHAQPNVFSTLYSATHPRKPAVKRLTGSTLNRQVRHSCCTLRKSRSGKASSFPTRPRPTRLQWPRGLTRAKARSAARAVARPPSGRRDRSRLSTAPRKIARKRKADAAAGASMSAQPHPAAGTPLRIPYGNRDLALKLGARYGSTGWYAPTGVDLSAFGERGWL
jgi:hypothetical protein